MVLIFYLVVNFSLYLNYLFISDNYLFIFNKFYFNYYLII